MEKLKFILLCCLIFLATSCEKLFNTDNVGQPIQFGATLSSSTPKTRTSYSGVVDGNTERIYWTQDDKVSIYMGWDDGNGYTGNPEQHRGIYNVNPGSDFHPNDQRYGHISHVNGEILKWQGDFNGGDGHAHEYPHTFYSACPPTDLINGKFTFDLPSNQDGTMKYAYMASYEKDVFSNTSGDDGHVELHYYPMITTFCLTIHNDLNEPIETITLRSETENLAGKYSVSVNNGRFGFDSYVGGNSGEVRRTINIGNGKTVENILFFIIPQNFNANELYFLLNSSETKRYIPKPIEAYYKYNINITVSEEEPDVEEPEPLPPLSAFVNGVIAAEAHKRGYKWQPGKEEEGTDPNKLYGEFQVPGGNEWKEVPPELIWEIIESVVDLDLDNTWEAKEITAEDLNIFPNLRTINIDASNLESIEVNNPNITSLNVKSQVLKHVKVEGCDGLTTFTMTGSYSIEDVTVKGNKNLVDFHIFGHKDNYNFYLLAESNPKLETFEVGHLDWQGKLDENAWGLIYRFDIKNCDSFKNYKVSNNAKTW